MSEQRLFPDGLVAQKGKGDWEQRTKIYYKASGRKQNRAARKASEWETKPRKQRRLQHVQETRTRGGASSQPVGVNICIHVHVEGVCSGTFHENEERLSVT